MEPEQDEGNIEYKLKLVGKSKHRIEGIATQMRYRCEEGGSECIYNIGVEDDGTIVGVTREEYDETLKTLNTAATLNKYVVTQLTSTEVDDDKSIYEVMVREHNEDKYIDIKVAIAGNVNAGKSSFLGVLTSGVLDNGRGSARLTVFNYPHEVKTGRTSSIGQHIVGFDERGSIINYNNANGRISWPEIVRKSSKVVTLYDLAGHEKYLKTTILGLSTSQPDVCLILVEANKGIKSSKATKKKKCISNMTKEHIFLCITLNIPFAIIVTKIDMMEDRQKILKETISDINKLIKHPCIRRQPIKVKTNEDVLICARQVKTCSVVPIFTISSVSGHGLDHIKMFLNVLEKRPDVADKKKVEYHIDNKWSVSGVGTVVGGHLVSGSININDKLWIGPNNGKYEHVTVRSIQCKRVPVQTVGHGSYVCLGLKKYNRSDVRRGNVMVSHVSQHVLCTKFTATIKVMKCHSTTIRIGYEASVHASSIRQSATLTHILDKVNSRDPKSTNNDNILRTGDTATCKFEMLYQPEFIVPGTRFLLCENRTKVIGTITEVENTSK